MYSYMLQHPGTTLEHMCGLRSGGKRKNYSSIKLTPCHQLKTENRYKGFILRKEKDQFYRTQGKGNEYMLSSPNKNPTH